MTTIQLTKDLRSEINKSIIEFDLLIKEEMTFDVDLRKHDKIITYTNKIIELNKYLDQGWM